MRIEVAGLARKFKSRFVAIVKLGDNKHKFVYEIPGNIVTLNQTELIAVKFALLGIDDYPAIIATYNQYVFEILQKEDGKWIKEPKSNTELVAEIRKLLDESKATIVFERSSEARDLCANGEVTI